MAGTVLRMNGTEVLEGSGKTVINVNFHQESSLSYLCKGVAALGRRRAASKAREPAEAPPARRRGEQKVLGVRAEAEGGGALGAGRRSGALVWLAWASSSREVAEVNASQAQRGSPAHPLHEGWVPQHPKAAAGPLGPHWLLALALVLGLPVGSPLAPREPRSCLELCALALAWS